MTATIADPLTHGNDTTALQALLDAYRAMAPVKEVIALLKSHWSSDGDAHWSSLATQGVVVESVVRDPVCDKFPPHNSYIYRFLKTYVGEIESIRAEVHDELVAELIEFIVHARLGDSALCPDDLHHVSFRVPRVRKHSSPDTTEYTPGAVTAPLVITCRVASVINEVGLKIWQAGWYLAEYIITHADTFADKTVLELGAGVGFTGLVLAGVTQSKRVLLSDYSASVMQNLRYNVEINAAHFQSPVDVITLDWETWDPSESADVLQPDILLAGDCVYDVAVFPALVRVLQVFLGASDAPLSQRKAIFAATIRNQTTFQAFLDQLTRFAIAFEDITAPALARMGEQMFPYENRETIRLCALTRAAPSSSMAQQ